MDRALELSTPTELLDQLQRRTHGIEWLDQKNSRIVEISNSFILVHLKEFLEHCSGLRTIFRKNVSFANILSTFPPGQRWLVEGDIANQIERIQISHTVPRECIQNDALRFELLENRLLSRRTTPLREELTQASKMLQ